MALQDITEADRSVILECVKAIAHGPFLDDVECHPRLGLDRPQLNAVLNSWPRLDDSREDSDQALAINNCLNEICYGVPISDSEWDTWFSVSRDQVKRVYDKWAITS